MRLIIISGLSGAGKSVALNTLEDEGYYCIDNLPLSLFLDAAKTLAKHSKKASLAGLAIGLDARTDQWDLDQFQSVIEQLRHEDFHPETVFLTAQSDVLLRRFSETRRRHPLTDQSTDIAMALDQERALLEPLEQSADITIDTTSLNLHELRALLITKLLGEREMPISVSVQSFGFKHSIPREADFLFDVRHLPNPYWSPELRALSGLDEAVVEFLDASPLAQEMIEQISQLLATHIPFYDAQGRAYLNIGIGCTGGRHRSVYVAQRVAQRLRELTGRGNDIMAVDRDRERAVTGTQS